MDRLQHIIDLMEAVENGRALEPMLDKAMDSQADYMADLNREQLDQGIRADGSPLPAYSPRTRKIKVLLGQQTDPMNLRDTGSFQDHIRTEKAGKFGRELRSTDTKEEILSNRYGEEILGLTVDNIAKVGFASIPFIQTQLQAYFKI